MKPSQRYAEDARLMLVFRNSYVELLNMSRVRHTYGSLAALEPRPEVSDIDWSRRHVGVAQLAGAASAAYQRHGGTYTYRNAAYVMRGVSPIENWDMSFRDPEQVPPDNVVKAVDMATAAAQQKAFEAIRRERGLTGLIAAFLRWPANLREAVDPERRGQRAAATAIGVFGQLVVGVLASVLATGVVAVGVQIWSGIQ